MKTRPIPYKNSAVLDFATSLLSLYRGAVKPGIRDGMVVPFDGTVNGDTKYSMCIEFAMYLLSFFVEIKKGCVHQVQVAMPNSIIFFLTSVEQDLTNIFTS